MALHVHTQGGRLLPSLHLDKHQLGDRYNCTILMVDIRGFESQL